MAKQIKNLSEEQTDRAASLIKSLSHPMRILIIKYLEDEKELSITQLYKLLNIEQSTTSYHLKILKKQGIIGAKRKATSILHYLKKDRLEYIIECVSRLAVSYY